MTTVKVAFVLDCTASMEPWIHVAKTKIGEIIDTVSDDHPHETIEVGLVAYRDYGDLMRFRTVDFTTPEVVMNALRNVRAEGGDDEAEDVANALYRMTRLTWEDSDICMVFHITDAPAHGRLFHTSCVSDRFPQGDPDGRDPRDSISEISDLGFHYTFIKITSSTDTMIDVFHNVWVGSGNFRVLSLTPQQFRAGIANVMSQTITQYTSSQDTSRCSRNPTQCSDYED